MKLRTELIISLFICLLVIGSVSAADNGTDDKVTLEDNSISEVSTTDSISEPKQEVKEVTTDEVSDKEVDNVNVKSTKNDAKNGKLEANNNEDVLNEVTPLEVDINEYHRVESSTVVSVSSGANGETGDLKIYINNDFKRSYEISNGKFNSSNSYSLYVTLKDLDITTDGTYQINVTLKRLNEENELPLIQKEITYTYTPIGKYINEFIPNDYEEYVVSLDIYEKGNLKIYVNDILKEDKIITNYEYDYGYSIDDLNLNRNGSNKLKIAFTPVNKAEIIVYDGIITCVNLEYEYEYAPGKTILTCHLPEDITGEVELHNGLKKGGKLIFNSTAQEIKNITKGIVTFDITKDSWYRLVFLTNKGNYNKELKIPVNDGNIEINITPTIVEFGNDVIIKFNSKNRTNYTEVNIRVDGEEFIYRYVSSFNKVLKDLTIGNHTIIINVYKTVHGEDGDELYNSYSNAFTINVKPRTSGGEGTNNGEINPNPINNGNNNQGSATSQGSNTDASTNTQSNTDKPSFTQTKTVKSISKKAKQLTISTTLKLGTKKAKKGTKVIYKIGSKTFKVKTNNKGVAKLTINKSDLKKILKKVKVGKKVKVQIKYGKTTVTRYIKVKK